MPCYKPLHLDTRLQLSNLPALAQSTGFVCVRTLRPIPQKSPKAVQADRILGTLGPCRS